MMNTHELYSAYLSHFNENQQAMAASLPAIDYCTKLINTLELSEILDLGSGVSTIIFLSTFGNVSSVDTHQKWANTTNDLIKKILNQDFNVQVGLENMSLADFDFIFYDYGNLEDRIFNFPKLLASNANYIYLDDMHILPYRYYVESKITKHRLVFLPETIDEYGRFGALLVRDQ